MGYRYQDATGQIQLAEDIHVLHQALKAGRLSADSMVLDESVKMRLKAAALIAFKARESAPAHAAPRVPVRSPARAPSRSNAAAEVSPSARGRALPYPATRTATERVATPASERSPKTGRAGWWLGLSLAGMLVLGVMYVQSNIMGGSADRALKETPNAGTEKRGDDGSQKADSSASLNGSGNGNANGEAAKQPLGRQELLKGVLPLLRKTHDEMMQNKARYLQRVDQLNLGQSMAPEVLLSRDGLARNAIRLQSFNDALDRYAQAEEARMQRLMEDVHRALDNRVGGPEFVRAFQEGLGRTRKDQDDFIRIQRELSRLFQQVTDFMLVRHGNVSLRDGSLVFSTQADAATYQRMMKELDRLAREESVVQGGMLETMLHMSDLLDEWAR